MNHIEEMKKLEATDHYGQQYINFATVPNSETRFEQEYYRTGRDSVEEKQVVTPEMRTWFFAREGWYADDDTIYKKYRKMLKKRGMDNVHTWHIPELTYAEHVEAKEKQVGGNHYTSMAITPREYNLANKLGWDEGHVVKYISRHGAKNGREDVEKALHYCELLLEEYDRQEANLT